MLFIIEIMLTVSAWRKGWKGWVVLPWLALLLIASVLGANAASEEEAFGLGLVCDIVLIVVLGIMAATAHGTQTESNSSGQSKQEQTPATAVKVAENQ